MQRSPLERPIMGLEHVMAAEQSKPKGPDLTRGVALDHLGDGGMVGGHVGDEAVLLARRGDEFFAIGATCSRTTAVRSPRD